MKTQRLFDILFGILGFLVFGPVILIFGILILLEDGGNIFFYQERIGFAQNKFRIWKLRTMKANQITKVGYLLRKTGLDELPQFWNVLIGDMSIVGPRPLTEIDAKRLKWYKNFPLRWTVKPGITGLAQIYAGRGVKMSRFYETYYILHKTIFMDLYIILVSFAINFLGKQRVRRYLLTKREKRNKNNGWEKWLHYFQKNANRPIPKDFYQPLPYRPCKVNVLLHSLCVFQIGETGEGRIVKEVQKKHLKGTDKNFESCIDLFIKEEGRHARLLGICIKSLGGKVFLKNWCAHLFEKVRRLVGVRTKLFVLSVAEVVGFGFYSSFRDKLPKSQLLQILNEIANDEKQHLLFHAEFFSKHFQSRNLKKIICVFWNFAVYFSMGLVFWSHRKTFKEFNITRNEFFHKASSQIQEFQNILIEQHKIGHNLYKEVQV